MIERENEVSQLMHQDPESVLSESRFDFTLRPQHLNDYVGQSEIKANLDVAIKAARGRKEPLEHILLHGAPGLGKTTLANIVALELGVEMKSTSGPAIEKQGDLASLLTNLKPHDVLFIDEIHRLKPQIEEVLYSAMEDFYIDIVIGKGPSARIMKLELPPFTLIGATTKMSMISSPLRDRFGHVYKLEFYSSDEIHSILKRSTSLLNISIEKDAALHLAQCSRQTPRIANRLLRRVRDLAQVNGIDEISISLVKDAMAKLGVDDLGLDSMDRQILSVISNRFKGGPVGLRTLAASLAEEDETIEEIYEPYLLQLGFLERSARGRMITDRALQHMNLTSDSKFSSK